MLFNLIADDGCWEDLAGRVNVSHTARVASPAKVSMIRNDQKRFRTSRAEYFDLPLNCYAAGLQAGRGHPPRIVACATIIAPHDNWKIARCGPRRPGRVRNELHGRSL